MLTARPTATPPSPIQPGPRRPPPSPAQARPIPPRTPPAHNDRRGSRRNPSALELDPAARYAARHHGAVAHWQLKRTGLGNGAIAYRLKRGRLHRLYRGVYLVGHAVPPPLAREAGALLACGYQGAVLSHRTAAAIWGLVDELPAVVDVTVVGRRERRHRGIRAHRTAALGRREIRIRDQLAVTAPARTVLDFASTAGSRELARAVDEARAQRLIKDAELQSLIARHPRRHGSAALRALLDAEREPELTRSEAERRMLALIERASLPTPRVNSRVGGHEVDLYWPDQRLVVEIDGYAYHSRPADFERDHRREQDLSGAGIRVSRVTWRQIVDEPEGVLVRLTRALFVGAPST